MRDRNNLDKAVNADESTKKYARAIIKAHGSEIVDVMEQITKAKDYKKSENTRPFTLQICAAAIEISYKSYFKTRNPIYLKKAEKLISLYDNLKKNGNIKLHLVADLC